MRKRIDWKAVAIVAIICFIAEVAAVGYQAATTIPIPPDTQQKIIKAFEREQNAQLQLDLAKAQREAVVSQAMAAAKCFPCNLHQDEPNGPLTFVPVPTPTPKP